MAKYVYPAVFTVEESGLYAVDFPDLESCYTSGDNLFDAFAMAKDVLELTLFHYEKDKRPIPEPSKTNEIDAKENEFVSCVAADTLAYQKRFNGKAVKKTLSIPEWLNELATSAKINFSKTLQEALLSKLNIQ